MISNRKTAIILGVLWITATVATIVAFGLEEPIASDPNYIINGPANANQVILGQVFWFIEGSAAIGIAVMFFPILKKHNEGLALGYVGFRVMEAVNVTVGAVSILTLVTLGQEFAKAVDPDASSFLTAGKLLLAVSDWTFLTGSNIFFSISGLIVYYLLYQSRIIPRFISVWGFIGAASFLAAGLLIMFGLLTRFSVLETLMVLPIGVQEMFLAAWLIVKGFKSSAIASLSAKTDTNKV